MSYSSDALTQAKRSFWPRPIPVTERLPEVGDSVMVFAPVTSFKRPIWFAAALSEEGFWWSWTAYQELPYLHNKGKRLELHFVTHWLPMPPVPE